MNSIFLLLLLGCCGWGNDGCCESGCRRPGRREGMGGCGCEKDSCGRAPERRRGPDGCGCEKEPCGRGPEPRERDRRPEPCGCAQERPCRKEEPCGCADGDGPGLIPPPWQDYPKFPHRDNGEDCQP